MSRKPKRTHRLRYGEGSFQWVESKQTWRGRIDAGFTPDGKRRRVEVTDRDEDKAWAKLIAKKKDLDDLTLDLSRSERTTVKQWLDIWLPERQRELSPGTFKTDNGYFRKWIIPTVGKKQLRDLGADDMRRIAARMRDADRSTTTIKYVQRIFQKALRDAQAEGYRVPETILLAKKAKEAVSDRGAIPLNDIAKILEVLAGRPDKSRWLAALMQGMRQGECLGLTWDHVDLDAGTIDVSRQLIGIPYADKKLGTFNYPEGRTYVQVDGAQHLSEPKTVSSRRIIPLTDTMITALNEWQGIGPRSPHGLVWCRPGGMPLNRKQDAAEWALIQQQAGVWKAPGERYVLHEARNSTATLLLELGVDPEVIKAILGHSNIVTTRRYQRVSQELALRALRQVESALQLGG